MQSNDDENPAQFIITTFQPEIVAVTDKIYGVSHSHRISKIDVLPREQALNFVRRDAIDRAQATKAAESPAESGPSRKRQKETA